jgi:hypothetical protein
VTLPAFQIGGWDLDSIVGGEGSCSGTAVVAECGGHAGGVRLWRIASSLARRQVTTGSDDGGGVRVWGCR